VKVEVIASHPMRWDQLAGEYGTVGFHASKNRPVVAREEDLHPFTVDLLAEKPIRHVEQVSGMRLLEKSDIAADLDAWRHGASMTPEAVEPPSS
jgi:hypothetical protein